jgi:hypothetical protein
VAAAVAAVAVVLLVALLLVDGTRWVEVRITDSILLVRGSHTIEECIEQGITTECGFTSARQTAVGAWPLAQYLIAVPAVAAGLADLTVLQLLAAVSSLAVGGMLVLMAFPVRRLLGIEWSVVLGVTLLTGPFLLYALLPFGEALSAFLALAFVVAACARRPGWLVVTGFLAGLTKETLAPFLFVLAVVCAREAHDRWLPAWRLLVPISAGLVGAIATNLLFNVFRFGTIRNVVYTVPEARVPGIVTPARLAIADWFAPNVGVFWFWTAAALLCAGLVASVAVLFTRARRAARLWLPPLAVVGVLAAYTVGLALWYSPFGWVAWGPRLTLPIIPAVLVAGIHSARAPMSAGLAWTTRNAARVMLVGAIVVVSAAAQVGVVWHRAAIELPLVTDAACPLIVPVDQASSDYFFGCGLHQAWRLDPLSLWESAGHGPAIQALAQAVVVVMVAAAGAWLHLRARDRSAQNLRARPTHG